MMKTTRFQILLTAFSVMLFYLAACTKEPSKSPPKSQTEETQPSPTAEGPSTSPGSVDTSSDIGEAARALVAKKWTGDLEGMIERRLIRVLTTYSKTSYFVDR